MSRRETEITHLARAFLYSGLCLGFTVLEALFCLVDVSVVSAFLIPIPVLFVGVVIIMSVDWLGIYSEITLLVTLAGVYSMLLFSPILLLRPRNIGRLGRLLLWIGFVHLLLILLSWVFFPGLGVFFFPDFAHVDH